MYIFNPVKKQSGIEIVVDALFGYFAYLHSLYTVVELHTKFVLIHFERQPTNSMIYNRCSFSGGNKKNTYIHNWPLQPFSQDY